MESNQRDSGAVISWLASYPKSGNTWVRLFLDAYLRDKEPDINDVVTSCSDNMAAFHKVHNKIEITDLPLYEQLLARPMSLLRLNYLFDDESLKAVEKAPLLVKTHNANITVAHVTLIPPQLTKKVLLIVRDPRDLVLSFAQHCGLSLEKAVIAICKNDYAMEGDAKGKKLVQYLMNWNWHTKSYVNAKNLEVVVVRFEDLKYNPFNNFCWILKKLDIDVDEEKVRRTIKRCELSNMMKQEDDNGFKECSEKTERFFGAEKKEQLSDAQREMIEESCGEMMKLFKYIGEEE